MPSSTSSHPDQRGVEPHPAPPRSINGNKHILSPYDGSASKDDMEVYAEQAVYDDPFSYCDTRYKIAGQWYGIPKLFAKSETLGTEVTSSTDDELAWKQRRKVSFPRVHASKAADGLVSLKLEVDGPVEVVYHKDTWNKKDYSHDGLGALIKKLNGDKLTNVTKPPESI